MKKIILFIMILTCIMIPQERKLSLDECVKTGLENNAGLHSSKQKVMYANEKRRESVVSRLPSLKFLASYTRLSDIDPFAITFPSVPPRSLEIYPNIPNSYNLKLSLQQPLFTGFRLSASQEMAEYNLKAQEYDYNKDELELILNIKTGYWNLFKTLKVKEIVDKNIELIHSHLDDVQNMFKQGLATKNDLLKVQVQLSDAQIKLIDAKNNIQLANIYLNNILQIPLSTEIVPTTEAENTDNVFQDVEQLKEKALNNREELKSLEMHLQANESAVKIAKSAYYPQIFLTGNYTYARPNQRIFPQQDKFKDTWDVSLSLNYDLWNWNLAGIQTSEAKAQLEQTKDSYTLLKDAINLEVTQHYLNYMQSKEKIIAAKNNIEQAEENYKIASEKFKEGLLLSSELLDAETYLFQANINYIQAVTDLNINKARLDKAISNK